MLQFTENKRKRDLKKEDKDSQKLTSSLNDPKAKVRKPAWIDPHASKIKVSIDDVSRLRKLKKTENEKEIEGDEYARRLKD